MQHMAVQLYTHPTTIGSSHTPILSRQSIGIDMQLISDKIALIMRELRVIIGVILNILGFAVLILGISMVCMGGTVIKGGWIPTVLTILGGLFLIWLGMRIRR